jgi:hypothetical protein
MGTKCVFRGSARLDLNRLKIGKQKCPVCRAEIVVTLDETPNYGLVPQHDKPRKGK